MCFDDKLSYFFWGGGGGEVGSGGVGGGEVGRGVRVNEGVRDETILPCLFLRVRVRGSEINIK